MLRFNKQLPADFPHFSTGSPPCHQNFSFPYFMISHVALKVTSCLDYQELIRTCKYFYSKNPVVVVEEIDVCPDKTGIYYWVENHWEYRRLQTKSLKDVSFKFWITSHLLISSLDVIEFATLNSKIYQYTLTRLNIKDVKLKYSDLVSLASKGTFSDFSLLYSDIVHDSPIDISDVVKLFVNAKNLTLYCTPTLSFTSETVRKLMDIPAFPCLKRLSLHNIPEVLNLEEFIKFKNKHFNFHSTFWTDLGFSGNISENYRNLIVDFKQKLHNANIYVHV